MPKKLTKEEVLNTLEANAKKLAVLLHDSNIPEDVKDAWIALLPEMSLEQIDRLLNILEAKYLDEQTREVDEGYKNKIEKVVQKIIKKEKKSNDEFLKKINKFKKDLKS